jgi:cob(I)alamin adenosyltransferase
MGEGTIHRCEAARRAAFAVSVMLTLLLGTAPAAAAVEQCRFIQSKAEREACYQRQDAALAAKRKPEPPRDTALEQLQQMRREDDGVYKSLRGICRGC